MRNAARAVVCRHRFAAIAGHSPRRFPYARADWADLPHNDHRDKEAPAAAMSASRRETILNSAWSSS